MPNFKPLLGSYSEPNVNLVYVCLVGNITPTKKTLVSCESRHSRPSRSSYNANDDYNVVGTSKDEDTTIEVQRSAAYHELLERSGIFENIKDVQDKIQEIDSETLPLPLHIDESDDDKFYGNPKVLSLTGNKWLSGSRDGSPDARETLSPTSSESVVSDDPVQHYPADKALSTVLALDKEHNLFGLSNTYIPVVGQRSWKKSKDSDSKAVFHQTAIVQTCHKMCCRRKSKTDLPQSLKCGGCRAKCRTCSSCTSVCSIPCGTSCGVCPVYVCPPPKPLPCPTCSGCCTPLCSKDCPPFIGLEVRLKRQPIYDPVYKEIEPKGKSILQKPFLARRCMHRPPCVPPSSCFPYLMPCFWPANPNAPCSEPSRCFHNPPCPRGRQPAGHIHLMERCPHGHPCVGKNNDKKCENLSCIGRENKALQEALTVMNKKPPPPIAPPPIAAPPIDPPPIDPPPIAPPSIAPPPIAPPPIAPPPIAPPPKARPPKARPPIASPAKKKDKIKKK